MKHALVIGSSVELYLYTAMFSGVMDTIMIAPEAQKQSDELKKSNEFYHDLLREDRVQFNEIPIVCQIFKSEVFTEASIILLESGADEEEMLAFYAEHNSELATPIILTGNHDPGTTQKYFDKYHLNLFYMPIYGIGGISRYAAIQAPSRVILGWTHQELLTPSLDIIRDTLVKAVDNTMTVEVRVIDPNTAEIAGKVAEAEAFMLLAFYDQVRMLCEHTESHFENLMSALGPGYTTNLFQGNSWDYYHAAFNFRTLFINRVESDESLMKTSLNLNGFIRSDRLQDKLRILIEKYEVTSILILGTTPSPWVFEVDSRVSWMEELKEVASKKVAEIKIYDPRSNKECEIPTKIDMIILGSPEYLPKLKEVESYKAIYDPLGYLPFPHDKKVQYIGR